MAVLGAGGLVLWRQHDVDMKLRRDAAELRRGTNELERQRAENRRLASDLPDPMEMARLRAAHASVPHLRAEIATMRAQVELAARLARLAERFGDGDKVAAPDWTNAGTATPRATLETVLWAAAGGDIDTFAKCLLLPEGRGRQRAISLLETLPANVREQYGTPERLVAFLAIKDVPIGTAQVVGWDDIRANTSSAQAQVQVQLSSPNDQPKDVVLRFSQDGANWRLLVPDGAIAKYTAFLDQQDHVSP